MAMIAGSTVVGVFEDRLRAEQAIAALHRARFTDEQVGYALRGAPGEHPVEKGLEPPPAETANEAASGAISGGIFGGIIGALIALLSRPNQLGFVHSNGRRLGPRLGPRLGHGCLQQLDRRAKVEKVTCPGLLRAGRCRGAGSEWC